MIKINIIIIKILDFFAKNRQESWGKKDAARSRSPLGLKTRFKVNFKFKI